jgi:Flp pilus assembly protein TadG
MYRNLKERGRGQALVEFAVVLPLLLLLLLALFDAGRGVLFYTELSNASRVGARIAIVNQSNDATCSGADRTFKCAAADLTTGMGVPASAIGDLTITGSDCVLPSNCTAKVTVGYQFQLITPIIGAIIGDLDLSATTTMPIERIYESPSNP